MAVKKIFVPLQNAAAAETSLKAAIAIARRHKAHIDALHIRQRPNVPAGGYYPVGVIFVDEHLSELKEALEAEAAALKEIFDRVMNAEGVAIVASAAHRDDAGATASWRDQQGVLPFDLSAAARVSDLIVFGCSADELGYPDANLIEEAIFQSGRPVIVTPPAKFERTPRRILVAWNGGREAARALSAAMPLFEETDAALVLSVGAIPADLEGPEKAAELLRLHGVKAEAKRRAPEGDAAAEDELLAVAKDWKADLIVMGAYSHSRWRELVLGGFTRKLLKQSDFPLFLAH
ncbi:MAG: universal stress protein [Parvularculaceae bacterium]|nr:universal stress protein [Parvularculaceae bacterium]